MFLEDWRNIFFSCRNLNLLVQDKKNCWCYFESPWVWYSSALTHTLLVQTHPHDVSAPCGKSGDGVSLKTEGSWGVDGSSHTDSSSRVGVGSL